MNVVADREMSLSDQARQFSNLHAGRATRPFIRNLEADVQMLDVGSLCLPVTNSETPGNAWVVSPVTTYGTYAREESERLAPALIRPSLRTLTAWATSQMQAAGLDRAVSVNNWLLSTNLYPALDGAVIPTLRDRCLERWPTQAIWLRSLNWVQHRPWLEALIVAGFRLIPTRQVYLFLDLKHSRRSNLRHDLALLRSTLLHRVSHGEFGDVDFARGEQLFAQLYLQKYSSLNPAYTAEFLCAWHRAGLLRMSGWRDEEGILQALLGIFSQSQVSTAPIVGYNTALPQSLGLYRLLMAQAFRHSMDTNTALNLSAGAGGFKRLRGGVPAIEYSAVYARHLPLRARRTLLLLECATKGFGVPLMKLKKL